MQAPPPDSMSDLGHVPLLASVSPSICESDNNKESPSPDAEVWVPGSTRHPPLLRLAPPSPQPQFPYL